MRPRARRLRALLAVPSLAIAAFAISAAPALAEPISTMGSVTEVSYSSVHVTGEVDNRGREGGSAFFEISTDDVNWVRTGESPVAADSVAALAKDIGGLKGNTHYFVRLVTEGGPPSPGPDPDFTTLPVDPPSVLGTGNASEVTYTEAEVSGEVNRPANPASPPFDPNPGFNAECFFEFVTDTQYGETGFNGAPQVPCGPENPVSAEGPSKVNAKLANLAPSTVYHLRLSVSNAGGSDSQEAASTFTTLGPVPPPTVIAIDNASNVFYTTAEVKGKVKRPGGPASADSAVNTTCQFEYVTDDQFNANQGGGGSGFEGASPVGCEQGPFTVPGEEPEVSAKLSGLAPATTYHLRLSASNGGGTDSKEAAATFTTDPIAKPTLTLDPVTDPTDTTATFTGKVETNAPAVLTPAAEAAFETNWHLSCIPACPKLTPEGAGTITAAEGSQTFSLDASELEPNTTYEVTIEASNGGGVSKVTGSFATDLIPATILNAPGGSDGEGGYFLAGLVNPHNSNVTECKFVYGPTSEVDYKKYPFAEPCSPTPTGRDEVQQIAVFDTSVQFKLSFLGQSATFPADVTAAGMQAGLEALSTIGPGGVAVTGKPGIFGGMTYTVTFTGPLASTNVPTLKLETAISAFLSVVVEGENNKLVTVEGHVTGLTPGATYHSRLVVTTGAGTQHTADQTFIPTLAEKGPGCDNEQLRKENNSLGLPECRAYEMVTDPNKEGAGASFEDFSGGDAVAYRSRAGNLVGSGESSLLDYSHYVATRAPAGWRTIPNLNGPTGSMYSAPESVLYQAIPYAFSADLLTSVWWFQDKKDSPVGPYLRRPDGRFVLMGLDRPLLVQAMVGASDDLSHFVADGQNGNQPGAWGPGVYEFVGTGNGQPRRVDIDNLGDPVSTCIFGSGNAAQGKAVSTDGRVIVFAVRKGCGGPDPANELWARFDATTSYDLSASLCTRADCNAPADANFQDAAKDGSRVYFTTTQQLLDADKDQTNDLYACDLPTTPEAPVGTANPCPTLHEVSAGSAGKADVEQVLRVSDDGSTTYFTAKGVLADDEDGLGEVALAGERNLYAWRTDAAHPAGQTTFVARLPESDSPRVQATPDGRYLLLQSAGQLLLTDTDNDTDIYRYDVVTGEMARVSTAVSGTGGNAAFDAKLGGLGFPVSSTAHNSHISISDNGKLIVFASEEALSPLDGNDEADAYLWNDGHALGSVAPLLPSTDFSPQPGQVAIDGSGQDIYIETSARLNPSDVDFATDVYDARIGGGFPQHQEGCSGEACQAPRSNPPATPTSPANQPNGEGNVKPPKPCPKGKVRNKKGKCVKKPKKHHKKKGKGKAHRASHTRGGSK